MITGADKASIKRSDAVKVDALLLLMRPTTNIPAAIGPIIPACAPRNSKMWLKLNRRSQFQLAFDAVCLTVARPFVMFQMRLGEKTAIPTARPVSIWRPAMNALPSRDGRAFIAGRQMLTGLAVGIAVFSPNLIWNITNGLATVRHTASNASWNWDRLFNFSHIFEFLGAQAGIIGPIAAGIFVVGLISNSRASTLTASDRLMLALSAPVIIVVTLQAFISRANANWAAPAFVTLCILVCAWAVRAKWNRTLLASTAMNVSIALFLCALAVSPAFVSAIGQENSVKRLRGWPEAGNTIITIASSAPFTAIMSDDREDMASLFYYTRARKIPLRMLPSETPRNEYEAAHALSTDVASYVLFVTRKQDVSSVTSAFASSERIGSIETRLDSKRTRVFHLYALRYPVTASTFPSK